MPQIEVVCAYSDHWDTVTLELPDTSTVGDALAHMGITLPGDVFVAVSVHGVVARRQQVLEEGDRIELLRPLLADPKENRRKRALGGS